MVEKNIPLDATTMGIEVLEIAIHRLSLSYSGKELFAQIKLSPEYGNLSQNVEIDDDWLQSQIENCFQIKKFKEDKRRRPNAKDIGKRVGLRKSGSLIETVRQGVVDSCTNGMIIVTFDDGETSLPMHASNFLLLAE